MSKLIKGLQDVDDIKGSVDSFSLVQPILNLRTDELKERGLGQKEGKYDVIFYHNGMAEIYEPKLTIYKGRDGVYRLRSDISPGKLFNNSNIQLVDPAELKDILSFMSVNIKDRIGVDFDAHSSKVYRVHYAANYLTDPEKVNHIISYFASLRVKWMQKQVIEDETVYFMNKSRGIRIYNKQSEIRSRDLDNSLIDASKGIVRLEYFINGNSPVRQFAKRIGLKRTLASELLSENIIDLAINEMKDLIKLKDLKICSDNEIGQIFGKTRDLKKVIRIVGFLSVVKIYGKDFYQNKLFRVHRSTYLRYVNECEDLGLPV